jgi:hypothetical protein
MVYESENTKEPADDIPVIVTLIEAVETFVTVQAKALAESAYSADVLRTCAAEMSPAVAAWAATGDNTIAALASSHADSWFFI